MGCDVGGLGSILGLRDSLTISAFRAVGVFSACGGFDAGWLSWVGCPFARCSCRVVTGFLGFSVPIMSGGGEIVRDAVRGKALSFVDFEIESCWLDSASLGGVVAVGVVFEGVGNVISLLICPLTRRRFLGPSCSPSPSDISSKCVSDGFLVVLLSTLHPGTSLCANKQFLALQ